MRHNKRSATAQYSLSLDSDGYANIRLNTHSDVRLQRKGYANV